MNETTVDLGPSEDTVRMPALSVTPLDHAASIERTGEFAPPDAAASSRGNTDATIDPSDASSPRTGDSQSEFGPKTIFDAGRATRDQNDESLPENRLLFVWSSLDRSLVNTRMTIRTQEEPPPSGQATNLVIQRRELRDPEHDTTSGADYELLERLGQGGMGVVYAARQASINRRVAIKRISPDQATNPQRQEKFLCEAVVTGELDHPNIVPIYDLGVDGQGALFYSMKCVQGTPWNQLITRKTLIENVEILMKVADALAFAHSRQVIHRDIKPENVMIGDYGEVLVMDWGLAIPADRAASRGLGGTPAYMAPEMARGPSRCVGIHSDIYLLGAVLFEILTGKPPHTGRDVMECLRQAAENRIRPTDVQGELMDIALRAMQREPQDRFPSVVGFQEAIRQHQAHSASSVMLHTGQHHLAQAHRNRDYTQFAHALFGFQEALRIWPGNEQARAALAEAQFEYAACALENGDYDLGLSLLTASDTATAELRQRLVSAKVERDARQTRLGRARRALQTLAAVTIIVISAALLIVNQQRQLAVRAQHDADQRRQEAVTAREKEEQEAYLARIGLADAKIQQNAFDQARLILQSCPENLRRWEWGRLSRLAHQSVSTVSFPSPLEAVAWSPRGDLVALVGWNGLARLIKIDPADCRILDQRTLTLGTGLLHDVAFSHDGEWLAVAGNEQSDPPAIYRTSDGARIMQFAGHSDSVTSVQFTPDDQRLVTTSLDNSIRVWNVSDGRQVHALEGHGWWVWGAAISPDGSQLASASQDGTVILWNLNSGKRLTTFRQHVGPVHAVAWNSQGQLASAGHDQRVLVWRPEDAITSESSDPQERLPVDALEGHGHVGAVRSLTFSSDGKTLASAGDDNTIRLWSIGHQAALRKTLRGHGGWVRSVRLSHDGAWLSSASHDQTLRFWNLEGYEEQRVLQQLAGHRDAVLGAVATPDGACLFSTSRDRTVTKWDLASGKPLQVYREGHRLLASSVQGSAKGKRLVTAAVDGTVRGWDVTTGAELFRLTETGRGAALAVSRGGDWLATSEPEGRIHVWNMHDIEIPERRTRAAALDGHRGLVTALAFDRRQEVLASGDEHGLILIWNTRDWSLRHRLTDHSERINALTFDAASRLYSASEDQSVVVWDVNQGINQRVLPHTSAVVDLKAAERAKWIITASSDGRVLQWRQGESTPGWELPLTQEQIASVAISPDDKRLAIVETDTRHVRVFDLVGRRELARGGEAGTVRPILDLAREGGVVWSAEFLGPWQLVTIGGDDARLWDLSSGKEVLSFGPQGAVSALDVSPDGRYLVTSSWDHTARVWDVATARVVLTLDAQSAGEQGAHRDHVLAAKFAPQSAEVATASADGTIKIWSLAHGRVRCTLEHGDPVTCLTFSKDGSWIYSGASDGRVRRWNARTGSLLAGQWTHAWGVRHLALSSDEHHLGTTGADRLAQVWRLDGPHFLEPAATLAGHTAVVTGIAFSRDGDRVFTSSEDGTAKVWEARSGKEILNLVGHAAGVTSVGMTAQDLAIVTTGRDGLVTVWTAVPWRSDEPPASPSQ